MKIMEWINFLKNQPNWVQLLILIWIIYGVIIIFLISFRTKKNSTNLNVDFASIELVTKECLWENLELDSKTRKYSSHLLPTFSWDKKRRKKDARISDPVFDVSIINNEKKAILLTKIGFQAVKYWTTLKGLPVTGRIKITDSYVLEVKEFKPFRDYFIKLEDQIHLEPGAVYRFKIRLKDYASRIKGNDSIIKLTLLINGVICRSNEIYLGLF